MVRLCKILSKELGLGDPDGFVFNMSVGYDLDGIKTPKVDKFIEEMKDASATEVFKEAMEVSLQAVKDGKLSQADIDTSVRRIVYCKLKNFTNSAQREKLYKETVERKRI